MDRCFFGGNAVGCCQNEHGNIFPLFLWHVQLEQKNATSVGQVVSLSSAEGLGHGTCQPLTVEKERISSNASELIFEIGGFQAFCLR